MLESAPVDRARQLAMSKSGGRAGSARGGADPGSRWRPGCRLRGRPGAPRRDHCLVVRRAPPLAARGRSGATLCRPCGSCRRPGL